MRRMLLTAFLCAGATAVLAQSYPDRPVRVVIFNVPPIVHQGCE